MRNDLLAYSHNILNRQKDNFSQVLSVHGTDDVKDSNAYS